jgi:large conductance mechanosensitive channel
MSILKEFKDFVAKGNVIDLAVGVVIGGAFGKLVEGVVKGVIEPVVGLVTGRGDTDMLIAGFASLGTGVGNFLLLAAVVFFIFVKPMNKLRAISAKAEAAAPPPEPPASEKLLTEIRDLLKER